MRISNGCLAVRVEQGIIKVLFKTLLLILCTRWDSEQRHKTKSYITNDYVLKYFQLMKMLFSIILFHFNDENTLDWASSNDKIGRSWWTLFNFIQYRMDYLSLLNNYKICQQTKSKKLILRSFQYLDKISIYISAYAIRHIFISMQKKEYYIIYTLCSRNSCNI